MLFPLFLLLTVFSQSTLGRALVRDQGPKKGCLDPAEILGGTVTNIEDCRGVIDKIKKKDPSGWFTVPAHDSTTVYNGNCSTNVVNFLETDIQIYGNDLAEKITVNILEPCIVPQKLFGWWKSDKEDVSAWMLWGSSARNRKRGKEANELDYIHAQMVRKLRDGLSTRQGGHVNM